MQEEFSNLKLTDYDTERLSSLKLKAPSGVQYEVHTFQGEYTDPKGQKHSALNPDQETKEAFLKLVDLWNETYNEDYKKSFGADFTMKGCILSLSFLDDGLKLGWHPVVVLQPAIYCRTHKFEDAVLLAHQMVSFFLKNGFTTIREKIEVMYGNVSGVPLGLKNEIPGTYFEFHIKLMKNSGDLDFSDEGKILNFSARLSHFFKKAVPFSRNLHSKGNGQARKGGQFFLNIRWRGEGLKQIDHDYVEFEKLCNDFFGSDYRIMVAMKEFVIYDTLPSLDHGWMELTPERKKEVMSMLSNIYD